MADGTLVCLIEDPNGGDDDVRGHIAVELMYRLDRHRERADLHAEAGRELVGRMEDLIAATEAALSAVDETLTEGHSMLKNRFRERHVASRLASAMKIAARSASDARMRLDESRRLKEEIEAIDEAFLKG